MRKLFSYSVGIWVPLVTVQLAASLHAGPESGFSANGQRRFTLRRAIETALIQNPDILRARQEIERTKGLVVEVRAQALPNVEADAVFQQTDSDLRNGGGTSTGTNPDTGMPKFRRPRDLAGLLVINRTER